MTKILKWAHVWLAPMLAGLCGVSAALADSVVTFNEIMYHPVTNAAVAEWVEFHNQMSCDVDISAWSLRGDISYDFPEGTVIPRQGYLVVAADPLFLASELGVTNALGPFSGRLSNGGGELRLRNNLWRLMDAVAYDDEGDWPAAPDGSGASLAKTDLEADSALPWNWSWSRSPGGTPGGVNETQMDEGVRLNEVSSALAAESRVELFNTRDTIDPLDLDGYTVTCLGAVNALYTFSNQVIQSRNYLLVDDATLGFTPMVGDLLVLSKPDGDVIDALKVRESPQARSIPGTGRWLLPNPETPGASNLFTLHDEIVINEIMYHAKPLSEPYAESPEEWLELYNRSSTNVDLTGWTLGGGIEYDFATGTTIPAGGYLVVAGDPVATASNYPAIDIVGPYSRGLSDKSDVIRLLDASGNPADEVRYYDDRPWPEHADGYGASLELRNPWADNSRPEAWEVSDESTRSPWRTYTIQGLASQTFGPTIWNECVFGMLTAGEVLVDDVSVIEGPGGVNLELMQNGSFEAAPSKWRWIGNHARSAIVEDPDQPGNHVLHLVSGGPTDTRHNHVETTFAGNRAINPGATYRVSFRAKWLRGSNQLNARLHFNRLARTFGLEVPAAGGTPGSRNSTFQTNIGPTYRDLTHAPAVPAAGQTVEVSVTAADPDGVAACTLFWAVDGNWGSSHSNTMTHLGNGLYRASIAGQAAGTVVQFYVSGLDALSASSTCPAAGRDSRALYQVQDGRASQGLLQNLRLIMTTQDSDVMWAWTNVMSNARMGCTVVYNESRVFHDVGVRIKGSAASRARDGDNYPGYTIYFGADNLFRGVHSSISIDRSGRSPVVRRQDEIYVKHLFNRAGIPCMYDDLVYLIPRRSVHQGTGLLMMARYGSLFVESQWGGDEGTVHNMEITYEPTTTVDGNPESPKNPSPFQHVQTDFTDLGDNKESYRHPFEIRTGRRRDDYTGLMRLCKAMALSGSAFDAAMGEVIDESEWMRCTALISLCGIGDQYVRGNLMHNFRVYVPHDGSRVVALPWDMDFVFGGGTLTPGHNVAKVFLLPRNYRLYYGHMRDLVNTVFNTAYMDDWLNHYGSVLNQNFIGQSSYIQTRGAEALAQLPATVVPFEITNAPAAVATDHATVSGRAWIDVKDVYLAGQLEPLELAWTSTGSGTNTLFFWSAVVPVAPGVNELTLLAYGFQGELVAQRELTILSTAIARPLRDHLRLTELMVDPLGGSDYEFIELHNTGPDTLDLSTIEVSGGVTFAFAGGAVTNLQPDAYVVIVRNAQAFASRYGTNGIAVAGEYTGKLDNGGEDLRIESQWNVLVLEFSYGDGRGWPLAADGAGHSLVPLSTAIADEDAGSLYYGRNWRASTFMHGSPGVVDSEPPNGPLLNELVAHTDYTNSAMPDYDSNDLIELYNPSSAPLPLTNWYLSDDATQLKKWAIPGTNVITAGGWLAFDEISGFHSPITNGFGLNKAGEQLFLSCLPGTSEDRVADAVRFKGQERNLAWGRVMDGKEFWRASDATIGSSNAPPDGDVVINEIMFNPVSEMGEGSPATDEYIELFNPLDATAELWTTAGPWRIDGGVSFTFPPGVTIAPEGYVVVVTFDPVSDVLQRDAFLLTYGLTNGQIRLFGPCNGTLSDRGERVALERPQEGDLPGDPVSYVIVDEAIYFARSPWPDCTSMGLALQRAGKNGSGNDPSQWYVPLFASPGEPARKIAVTAPLAGSEILMPVHETVTAAVDEARVDSPIEYVEFFLDGGTSLGRAYAPPFSVQLTSSQVVEPGAHTLHAVLRDASGDNVSQVVAFSMYESLYKDWAYRMKIRAPGYDGQETLQNFALPVLLHEGLNGYRYHQVGAGGGSLRFADASGTNTLFHEIEKWDTNGTSAVWVRLNELSGSDTFIWAYWGNASATSSPAYTTDGSVWPEYNLVHHLSEGSGSLSDSSSNGVSSAGNSVTFGQTGVVGDALGMSSTASRLKPSPVVPLGTEWTIGVWVKDLSTVTLRALAEVESQSMPVCVSGVSNELGMVEFASQTVFHGSGETMDASDGQWHQLVGVGDNGRTRFYVDGELAGVCPTNQIVDESIRTLANVSSFLGGRLLAGHIDEYRVEPRVRSADWIRACWLSHASNDVFLACGAAEDLHPGSVPVVDADGDGMLDAWEIEHFGSTNVSAEADGDGDGMSNGGEFIAGTDPTNAASVFALGGQWSSGAVVVDFVALDAAPYGAGYSRWYSLERATNLLDPQWGGVPGYTNILGSDQGVSYSNGPGGNSQTYFRGQVWLVE